MPKHLAGQAVGVGYRGLLEKKTGGLHGGGPPVKRSARGLLNRSVEAGFVQGFLEGGG
jgi:hypothetical protein